MNGAGSRTAGPSGRKYTGKEEKVYSFRSAKFPSDASGKAPSCVRVTLHNTDIYFASQKCHGKQRLEFSQFQSSCIILHTFKVSG